MEQIVRSSQQTMVNPLMIEAGFSNEGVGVKQISHEEHGEVIDVEKKVRREFKDPSSNDKLYELRHKRFAPESRKKMRWAVNMFCD